MTPKLTAAQRRELSDAAAESRDAYERDMADRRQQFNERAAKWRDRTVTMDAAFETTGLVAEFATALATQAGQLGDPDIAAAAKKLRQATTRVGNLLTQRRRVYHEGA